MLLHVQRVRVSQINGQAESGCTRSFARTTWESHLPNPIHFRLSVVLIWSTLDDTKVASLKQDQLVLAPRSVGNGTPWRHLRNERGNEGCDWMWSVRGRYQQGSWMLAVRALQRRSRGMRRRTRAGRSAGMLAGEVLTPNISARRQAQQSTLRRPRDGLGMRGGSSRPLRTQPKCTSRRGHRHRRGASCRCAGAARAAKRPAVRSTRRPRPASCTRTLWGTSGRTRRSPQSCETGTGGAGRARGR